MSSQTSFEHRANTRIIKLDRVAQEFVKPERLRLKLSSRVSRKKLDIGSWAYFLRGDNESIHDDRGTPVVVESFIQSRRQVIRCFLDLSIGQRDKTVLTMFVRIGYFIDWLNLNGYQDVFAGVAEAQHAYRGYSAYLNHRIAIQELRPVSAANLQTTIIRLIERLYPEGSHYILSGAVRFVSSSESAVTSISELYFYRDVCLAIASQCSDFLIKNNKYPLVVKIRNYEVVVFPSHCGSVGPFKESPLSYNALERRIATVEEYLISCDKLGKNRTSKSQISRSLKSSEASLRAANEDARHWHRIGLAGLAMKAYVYLFLMITGATPTEVEQFKYADALKVEKSPIKNELSAVKFRAAGKLNAYNIGRGEGLSLLKEYLKLRQWILNESMNDRLFFSMHESAHSSMKESVFGDLRLTDTIHGFYNTISGTYIDPQVQRLSPRKIRKLKSNGLHTAGYSPSTVAASMGHTEAVNYAHYAEAAPEQLDAEFSKFWNAIRNAANVMSKRSEIALDQKFATGVGHCNGFNQPIPVRDIGTASLEPNCLTQYGCLYCEHYVCHCDKEDIHKLLSLQYVINSVRKCAPDTGHAEELYRELSIRIEFILDALVERADEVKQLVETARINVFEYGELTVFWEARLRRYEKMGVIF